MIEVQLIVERDESLHEAVQLGDDLAIAWMVLARSVRFDVMAQIY